MHVLLHILGLDNGTGSWYLFWSGIGSDLGEFAIAGAIWHHVACHESRCWRIARHQMGGYCRRHRKPLTHVKGDGQ